MEVWKTRIKNKKLMDCSTENFSVKLRDLCASVVSG